MHLAAPVLAWLDMPVAVGGGSAVTLALIVAYRLITDRTAVKAEIGGLVNQVKALTTKVDHLEVLYDEQRGLKHQAYNDLARTSIALELVRGISVKCSCGVLSDLDGIIASVLSDLETSRKQHPLPS